MRPEVAFPANCLKYRKIWRIVCYPPSRFFIMEFDKYSFQFAQLAILNGYTTEYVDSCLKYAKKLADNNLPIIYDSEHFSELVGFKLSYIKTVVEYPKSFYWIYKIKKHSGGIRKINAPLPNLKQIQYWILENILNTQKVSPYAKAFVHRKKLKENVRFHRNRKIVIKFDVHDFFGSIRENSIKAIFRSFGYINPVADLLAMLCCLDHVLPQGAPTSPYLSNLFMLDFDAHIALYCKEHTIYYTRYADDLTFSSDSNIDKNELTSLVKKELNAIGLYLNNDKTKVMPRNTRQVVTGIVVNQKLQVDKDKRRKIRQEVFYIKKWGLESHLQKIGCSKKNYLKHLLGEMTFMLSLTPQNLQLKADIEYIRKLWEENLM